MDCETTISLCLNSLPQGAPQKCSLPLQIQESGLLMALIWFINSKVSAKCCMSWICQCCFFMISVITIVLCQCCFFTISVITIVLKIEIVSQIIQRDEYNQIVNSSFFLYKMEKRKRKEN